MDFSKYGFSKLAGTWYERKNMSHKPISFRHRLIRMRINYWSDGWVQITGEFHTCGEDDTLFEGYIRKQEDFDTIMRLILDDENYGLTSGIQNT